MNNKDRQLHQTLSLIFRVADGIASEEELVKYARFTEVNGLANVTLDVSLPPDSGPPPATSWPELEQRMLASDLQPIRVVSMRRKRWMAAAAVLLLCLSGLSLYYYFEVYNRPPAPQAGIGPANQSVPSYTRAMLLLNNNVPVTLHKNADTTVAVEGNVNIATSQGALTYTPNANQPAGKHMENILITPPQGMYKVILSDGTKVTLNAETQLSYPVSFAGATRHVQLLKGEAYFEVAHAGKPFLVTHNNQVVAVLGTHFNINAYDDNKVKTTLLTGSIRLEIGIHKKTMTPGQQAITQTGKDTIVVSPLSDTANCIAWTKGLFNFNNMPVKSIMEELSRWYDVEIVCSKEIATRPLNQYALPRESTLEQALYSISGRGTWFRYTQPGKDNKKRINITAP